MNNNLSKNLKKIRKENNLSQEQLAEKLGVSRQAISKWESEQAYPEMDKILSLANMFNLNIDDLLNNDINEVKKEETSKNNINKYMDDFLNFISNTVKMICTLDLKTKIKCFLEQAIIAIILVMIFHLLGSILGRIFLTFIRFLPRNIYNFMYQLLSSVYLVLAFILSVVIMVHVFKTRYLDYYTKNVNEDVNLPEEKNIKCTEIISEKNTDKKLNNNEKIVIRDPNHSEYKFIKGLLKLINLGVKFCLLCMILFLSFLLVIFLSSLLLSFKILGTGLFFIGLLTTLISISIINILLIIILINFVIGRKNNNRVNIIVFVSSIILCGIGVGVLLYGVLNFDYIDAKDSNMYKTNEVVIPLNNNAYFNNHIYDVIYIKEDRDDIKVKFKSNKYCNVRINYDEEIIFNRNCNNRADMIKEYLSDVNKKKIYNLDIGVYDVEVYASEGNINILKQNRKSSMNCFTNEVELSDKNYKLEQEIEDYKRAIEELEKDR